MEYIVGGGIIVSVIALVGMVHASNCKTETKISRVYGRLDEVREEHDRRYQSKDVCAVQHKHIMETLVDLKTDVKLLLKKNGIN